MSAWPVANARFVIVFNDAANREVDLRGFLCSAQVEGTIFAALRDAAVTAAVRVALGTVTWPDGADLAPEAMEIRANGVWRVT